MTDDDWVIHILVAGCWIDIATYSCVLGLSLHNAVKFLALQGRWKNFYLTGFYVLTVLVALTKILFYYSSFRILFAEEDDLVLTRNTYVYSYSYNIALTTKATLGIFQIGSMVELAINVRLSA